MFPKHQVNTFADFSTDLSDEADWKVGTLREFAFPLHVTALAVEPIAGLLAAGTADGFIYIFGGPSVESKLSLQATVGARFLQFSIPTYFLLCLDENNQLHIYNLLEFGRPKPVTSVRFDQTNSLTLSPSHTHVFLAMQKGEIKTYDLTCLRKSPYTIPNLWKLYEENEAAKGLPSVVSPAPQDAIETVIHPRNLNQLFVAYSGGVVLTDLSERNIVRAYDLILRPGAPGGGGYGAGDIFTHRRLLVTSIAVHPTGHLFAVGYEDGSIAFWAVEDDEKPLVVRTLDNTDVDMVDMNEMENLGSETAPRFTRDPIFKISWSGFPNSADPRGGETVLTVLGGHTTGKQPGVTVFAFPAFNPPDPPVDNSLPPNKLHPVFRQSMCHSVTPSKSFFYQSDHGIVQDYFLLPRNSPHFGSTFEPYVMLLMLDIEGTRTVEATEFPPPGFVPIKVQESEPDISLDEAEEPDVQNGPQQPIRRSSTSFRLLPLLIETPFTLSNARSHIRGGRFFTLGNEVYENFILQKVPDDACLDLRGGQALVDSNDQKVSKYQPRRILLTYNQDNTVRFFDFSTTLLIPSDNGRLRHAWPKPIPTLTIWLNELFDNTSVTERLSTSPNLVSIQSVEVAAEALEVGVALTSGEVIIYHSAPRKSAASTLPAQDELNPAIVLLDRVRNPRQSSRLLPYFMLCLGKPVETFALSDIGFLAVACKDGTLTVVDMRGPRIILSPNERRQHKRRSQVPNSPSDTNPEIITCLRWSICSLDNDPRVRVRLIAILKSGGAEIYTPICSGNPARWSIFSDVQLFKAVPDALPDGTFVLDAKSGSEWRAVPAKLAMAFKNEKASTDGDSKCIFVCVGAKTVRVTASINGEKVSKLELGHKLGHVVSARVIAHSQSHALVMQTDKNDLLIYTLPRLEHVATLRLPNMSPLPLLIDDGGDFIAWSVSKSKDQIPSRQRPSMPHINGAIYGTFFDYRRAYPLPDIDFISSRGTIPLQPQPVSLGPPTFLGGLGSWLPFNQTISGQKIDELLGGPDRPIPEKIALEKTKSAEEDADGGMQSTAAGLAASAANVQANLYNRLTSALGERGQLLGDLEERFNSLEEGSRNMVAQAKRLATQQTAKSWFGF